MSDEMQITQGATESMSDISFQAEESASFLAADQGHTQEHNQENYRDNMQEKQPVPLSPEDYVFSFQPDVMLDQELLESFKSLAHKKGLSQEDAQEYARFYEQAVLKNVAETQSALIQQESDFRQQCRYDQEIGGARFDESVAHATRAIERFSTPGLLQVLHETGFGSHPEVVRFCVRIGKALAEKPMPKGEEATRAGSLAEMMFPSMSR